MTRLILYNIAYGQGVTGKPIEYLAFWRRLFASKKKVDEIGSALKAKKPDIVGLVEVDSSRSKSKLTIKKTQFSLLQQQLQSSFSDVSCKYASRGITSLARFIPILRKQSNGILSNYEIISHQHYYLSRGLKRLVSKYVLRIGSKNCTIFLVHLALSKKVRIKQLQELSMLTHSVDGPMIVMGDFNAGAQELAPLLFNGKKLRVASTSTASQTAQTPAAADITFPTYKPKRQLDYILTSPQISVKALETYTWQLSDHLPICLDFEIL